MGGFGAVRQLAGQQNGAVTLDQMRGRGISERQVERGLERGDLARLHRGVYRLGPVALPYCLETAAVLASGPAAVLSDRSAPYVYGMLPRAEGPVHVTVRGEHRRGDAGIVVHTTSLLRAHEIRERHGIPVISPIRTLIDLAAAGTDEELDRAVAEAFALRLTNLPALQRAASAYRGRRGVGRLQRLLQGGGPRRTRSGPERELLLGVRRARLPEPETNAKLGRWEVDFLWRAAGLVVEVDAYSTHSSPWAFERDRRKDAELAMLGLRVQRFTADRVHNELDSVLAWLRQSV